MRACALGAPLGAAAPLFRRWGAVGALRRCLHMPHAPLCCVRVSLSDCSATALGERENRVDPCTAKARPCSTYDPAPQSSCMRLSPTAVRHPLPHLLPLLQEHVFCAAASARQFCFSSSLPPLVRLSPHLFLLVTPAELRGRVVMPACCSPSSSLAQAEHQLPPHCALH